MQNLNKSDIVNHTLDCIIRVIEKRKSDLYAIKTLSDIIKQLEPKYDFLKFIKIDTSIYSETWIAVQIDHKLDSVDDKIIGNAFSEIIDKIAKSVQVDEDYYFIREIRDELKYEIESILKKFGVDLNLKQFEYSAFKTENKKIFISHISNSETVKPILISIIKLLNQIYPKYESVKTLNIQIKKLETKYNFLKNISINYRPASDEFYTIDTSSEINDISSLEFGNFIKNLLEEIGSSIKWNKKHSFIDSFKFNLSPNDIQKINDLGVNLDDITIKIQRQKHKDVAEKILDTVFNLLAKRTSKETAFNAITKTITYLKKDYEVLGLIDIYPSNMEIDMDIFQVRSEISNIESYKIGKAFKEMIKSLHDVYGDKTFISEFKNRIGEEYLIETEKIGLNLHILEMRFGW